MYRKTTACHIVAGKPQKVNVGAHGNAKHSLPFHPSDRSLLDELNQRAKNNKATQLYNEVSFTYQLLSG